MTSKPPTLVSGNAAASSTTMACPITVPVAYFVFNRPDLTARSLATLARARPRRLFVVADGPRPERPADAEKCRQVLDLLRGIDWPCDVQYHIAPANMGCDRRIVSGIEWVFSQVDRCVFLEDDVLIAPSLLPYMQAVLERYRDDERVFHVNGVSFIDRALRLPHSYFFSKYVHSHGGWATWRRAWRHFDARMSGWPDLIKSGRFDAICPDPYERRYWLRILGKLHGLDTEPWDYRWLLTIWNLGKLAVYPAANMVSNIGYGHPESVHTKFWEHCAEMPLGDLRELRHPPQVQQYPLGDHYDFNHAYEGWVTKKRDGLRGHWQLLRDKLRYRRPLPPYYPVLPPNRTDP